MTKVTLVENWKELAQARWKEVLEINEHKVLRGCGDADALKYYLGGETVFETEFTEDKDGDIYIIGKENELFIYPQCVREV